MRKIHTPWGIRGLVTGFAIAAAAAGRPAEAQLPSATARALGMGDNYTAVARGRNAPAWNPANLALSGGPGFSLAIAPIRVFAGISPVTLGDVSLYDGALIPASAKEEWLERILASGRQRGTFGVEATELSLNAGRLAFQVSSIVAGRADLGPDAAELLLFGNAGRTGEPGDFDLEGSALDLSVTTTFALSYGLALPLDLGLMPDERFTVGATVKYTLGNFMVSGRDNGSYLTSDPLEVGLAFPIVQSDDSLSFDNGSGFGVDVGAAWQGGPITLGVMVRNAIQTFSWDAARMVYRPGTVVFDDSAQTNFEVESIDQAPESVRAQAQALIDDFTYKPALIVGGALRLSSLLTLSADIRHRLSEGLDVGPATHAGVGAELRLLSFLPLRGGVTYVNGGYQLAGGAGIELGFLNVNAAGAFRSSDTGENAAGMLSISFGGS